jgi:hypothetical protein
MKKKIIPKDLLELMLIIEKEIKDNGRKCDLNHIHNLTNQLHFVLVALNEIYL